MKMITKIALLPLVVLLMGADGSGCDSTPTADKIQRQQQEVMLKEATAAVGMPAIKNFRERKLLKDILEMRDQDGLITYTYLWNEMQGRLVFFCNSIGYGVPYATQYTAPERPAGNWETPMAGNLALPQADPNGLFSPASAEGTWVMCKDPNGKIVRPVYVEPRVVVSQFKLSVKDEE